MPSSRSDTIDVVCQVFLNLKPEEDKILALGMGFGKYGVLAREYTDIWRGNIDPKDWKMRIDGVEGFKPYTTLWQELVYSNIYNAEILMFMKNNEIKYDVILLIDVLEHFSKQDGIELLLLMQEKCNKYFVVVTPINVMNQSAVNENNFERHISQWEQRELMEFGSIYTNDRAFVLLGEGKGSLKKELDILT